jgi:hypothetical protein
MFQQSNGITAIQFGSDASGSAPPTGFIVGVRYLTRGPQLRYEQAAGSDGAQVIVFGDGISGAIPESGAPIEIRYRNGGGTVGNVARGAINGNVLGRLPNGSQIQISVTNLEAASGGEAPEAIDRVKLLAPAFAKSNQRAVTAQDFTVLASSFSDPIYGSPSFASAKLARNQPERNEVLVAVWSRDANGRIVGAGTALQAGVKKFLDSKRTICTYVRTATGEVLYLDVDVCVRTRSGYSEVQVFADVQTEFERFFLSTDARPGADVALSKLYERIQRIDGVDAVVISVLHGTILQNIELGAGTGNASVFSGYFAIPEGSAISPLSVRITDGLQVVSDDGFGNLVGAIGPGAPNTVNYETGSVSFAFAESPENGVRVTAQARTIFFGQYLQEDAPVTSTQDTIDFRTTYHPVRGATFRPMGSCHVFKVLEQYRIGTSNEFIGTLSPNINDQSLSITIRLRNTATNALLSDNWTVVIDAVPSPSSLLVVGLPAGSPAFVDGSVVGTVNRATGSFHLFGQSMNTLLATIAAAFGAPLEFALGANAVIEYTSKTAVLQYDGPITPGRAFIRVSPDMAIDQSNPPVPSPSDYLGESQAYDDGDGNVWSDAGALDVSSFNSVNYDSGKVMVSWLFMPPDQGGDPDYNTIPFSTNPPVFTTQRVVFDLTATGGVWDSSVREYPFSIVQGTTLPWIIQLASAGTFNVGDLVTFSNGSSGFVNSVAQPSLSQPQTLHVALRIGTTISGTVTGPSQMIGIAVTSAEQTSQANGINVYSRYGVGRMQLLTHQLSVSGAILDDVYDNGYSRIYGPILDDTRLSCVDYARGRGRLVFLDTPPVTAARFCTLQYRSVVQVLTSGLVWAIKRAGSPGNIYSVFADADGYLWNNGGAANYPVSKLDLETGQLEANLVGLPMPTGRRPLVSYDAEIRTTGGVVRVTAAQATSLGTVNIKPLARDEDA